MKIIEMQRELRMVSTMVLQLFLPATIRKVLTKSIHLFHVHFTWHGNNTAVDLVPVMQHTAI